MVPIIFGCSYKSPFSGAFYKMLIEKITKCKSYRYSCDFYNY